MAAPVKPPTHPTTHDLTGKYPHVGTIQKPFGEEGGTYILFTGKYGNINSKMKITCYPTLPCEYNTALYPTLSRMEGSVWKIISHSRYLMMKEDDILTAEQSRAEQPGRGGASCQGSLVRQRATGLSTSVLQEKTHTKSEPLIPAYMCPIHDSSTI